MRYLYLKHLNPGLLRVNVCCLGEKGEFGRKIEELGYHIDTFQRPYGLLSFITTWKLYRYIKKHKFDIVHSALFYANYHSAIAARLAGVKFIITEEHGEHNLHWKKKYFIYRFIGRWIAGISTAIFCCSDFVKYGIQKMYGVREDKIRVLKNLMEDKKKEIMRPRDAVRSELGVPADAFVMGTVSSLYWIKNQKLLIDLLAQPGEDKLFLVLVGDGPLKNDLFEYALRKQVIPRVRFTGWRNDVADILNAFDVFILPSLSEGLPISLLEAMSAGIPCIASRVGGVAEIIKDNINGILVSTADLGDLGRALKRVRDDSEFAQNLVSRGRRVVIDNFSPTHYVNAVYDSYRRLINGKIIQRSNLR